MALTTGCAATLDSKQVDYERLPGSGDRMADGSGLFGGQEGDGYDGGYTIYSDNPSQPSLVRTIESLKSPTARAEGTSPSAEYSAKPTASQEQDYREFQKYQQYKRFKQLPEDSAEYKRFREWREWQQYQQWRKQEADPY